MATVPALPSLPAGYLAQPADMNGLAAVAQFFINGKPFAQTRASTTQAFTGGVLTVVTFGTKTFDNDGMFSAGFNGLTVQTNGWYRVSYAIPLAGISDGVAQVTTGANNPAGSGITQQAWPANEGKAAGSQYSVAHAAGTFPNYLYALDQMQVLVSLASANSSVTTDFAAWLALEWIGA